MAGAPCLRFLDIRAIVDPDGDAAFWRPLPIGNSAADITRPSIPSRPCHAVDGLKARRAEVRRATLLSLEQEIGLGQVERSR